MADHAPLIARIRLSRSMPRLLALPALGIIVGAGLGVGSLLVPGIPGLALAATGGALALVALAASIVLLSIRLDVEETAARVRWIGGERLYGFAPGPITRVRLRGEDASRLRASGPRTGWQLGPALLRDDEPIEVIRLAPTSTAILIPTARGRLAIGAANEDELLDALSRAARARQRLDEPTVAEPQPAAPAPVPEPEPETEPETEPGVLPETLEEAAPFMTGIERAQREAWLAEEQARAEAAEADRVAAIAAAEIAAAAEAATAAEAASTAAIPATGRGPDVGTEQAEGQRTRHRRRWRPASGWRPGGQIASQAPSIGLAVLPLAGAGAVWGLGLVLDRMPAPGSDLGRLTALALVLAGPATTVGAIMARAWWPRLVGVVVVGGLAASVFVGRALVGG